MKTRTGAFERSTSLYFGKEYENEDMESLYNSSIPQLIVGDVLDVIKTSNRSMVKEFLTYFGVNKYPKITRNYVTKWRYGDFYYHVLREAKYPLTIVLDKGRHTYKSVNELYSEIREIENVFRQIDHIDDILNNASTKDIIHWLLIDKDVRKVIEDQYEPVKELQITRGTQQKPRPIPSFRHVRSFICWKFLTIPWLEIKGKRYSLRQCLLEWDEDINLEPFIFSYSVRTVR